MYLFDTTDHFEDLWYVADHLNTLDIFLNKDQI